MQYPHWLMVAGAVMVAIGFIGVAFHRNRDIDPNHEPAEMKANEKREEGDSHVATLPDQPWRQLDFPKRSVEIDKGSS
jgi:hypothetical protein